MNKGKKHITSIIGVISFITLLIAQGSGYLSQKLMVENDIRDCKEKLRNSGIINVAQHLTMVLIALTITITT